jgi:hypothetical protein
MRRYDLAYRFIPYLIAEFNKGNLKQAKLLDELFFKEILNKEENDFNSDDLIIEHKILSKTKSVGIYIFPEPLKMPEAKFGLLFFDFERKITRYYTLEKSNPSENGKDCYMIGSTPELGTHLNHGNFEDEPTIDIFLNHIYSKYEKESTYKIISFLLLGLVISLIIFLLFKT